MVRKVGVSVSLEPEQAAWLDEQDSANSEVIRELIDDARGER